MKRTLSTLLFLLVISTLTEAAPDPLSPYFAFVNPELDWAQEKWTGSDAPFLASMQRIGAQIAKGRKRDELVRLYQSQAERQPKNASAQFDYAYAIWRSIKNREEGVRRQMEIASQAMAQPASPRSYQYTRLRWLIERVGSINGSMQMTGLGKRLIARQPSDRLVKWHLTLDLLGSPIKSDTTVDALRYGEQLAAQRPNDPTVYSLLGDVYRNISSATRSATYADKSIVAYKKCLALAPSNRYPQYREFVSSHLERAHKLKQLFS